MVRGSGRRRKEPPLKKVKLEKDVTDVSRPIKSEIKTEPPSEQETKITLKDKIEKKLKRLASGEESFPKKIKEEEPKVTKQEQEEFKETYYNPTTGFRSAAKQVAEVKSRAPGITYKAVSNLVSKQEADLLTTPQRKPKVWNTIVAAFPGSNYQMDLMNYNRYEYGGYDWILNIVDVNSRKAGSRAIASFKIKKGGEKKIAPKVTGAQYLKAYIDIIAKDFGGKHPKHLSCDVEFVDKNFVGYVTHHGTKIHYSQVGQYNKNAIVERFNGTLANLIQRWRVGNKNHDEDWPKVLPELIENYNNTYHSTIKAIPEQVWIGQQKNNQTVTRLFNNMEVGDKVKRKIFFEAFKKGDVLKYSEQTYVLVEKIGNRWKIKDIETGEIYCNPKSKIKTETDRSGKKVAGPELFKEDQLIRVGDILTKPTDEEAQAKIKAEEEQEKKFMKPEEEKELEKKEAIVDEAGRQMPVVESPQVAKEEAKQEEILKVRHAPVLVGPKKRKREEIAKAPAKGKGSILNYFKPEKEVEADIKSKVKKKLNK